MRVTAKILLLLLAAAVFLGCAGQRPPEVKKSDRSDASDRSDKSEKSDALPTIAEKTRHLERRAGFLTFYLDPRRGKIWLEVPPSTVEVLYVEGLVTGLGSNPVGLDRGQWSDAKLLRLRRLGGKVLVEEPNLGYRAGDLDDDSGDGTGAGEAERRAAAESFATSVLWAGEIAALDADGRSLVDFTSFAVRDAHGVVAKLRETGQGGYSLDAGRSALDPEGCLAFPDNVELRALLTYATGGDPGKEVEATAPTPTAVTLVQHHSLVRLPDDGYRPRRFDPRMGFHPIEFHDYAAPLDEPLMRRWITRHRLEKADPSAPTSPAVEPLVYYVDPGIPEPVRSAVIEGAGWWAAAFEAAGFEDAFRVELLPEDAHPLDVRYNVVQWVHRATRGWSYGGGVVDPRTGEIVKGHVLLGSLRVRQDRLIFEGLAGTGATGSGTDDDPIELALARIRQLAAHEVGHTLGLGHNFAASTLDRASVMDYPAPWVRVGDDGDLDFSRAYAAGVGAWDRHTIRWGYGRFPPGADESAELDRIVREGLEEGWIFLSDEDARPPGASDPRANLWDNGDDAVAELQRVLEVRRIALADFGADRVEKGRPLARLEEVLAPIYFYHRYQLDAAVKAVGGMEYHYALRGDGQEPTRVVAPERQRRALRTVLGILEPEVLDLPEPLLELLAPPPFEHDRGRERFATATAPAFDAVGAARTAADQVVTALLHPERLARLHDFHRRDGEHPGVEEVVAELLPAAFDAPPAEAPRRTALRRAVQRVVADRLIAAASSPAVRPGPKAWIEWGLTQIRDRWLDRPEAELGPEEATLRADVVRFLERRQSVDTVLGAAPAEPPPGSPIGAGPIGSACTFDDF